MAESVVVRSEAACSPTMPSTPSAKIRMPISASRRYAPVCCCREVTEGFMVQAQGVVGQACGSVAGNPGSGAHSLVAMPIPVLLITTRRSRGPVTLELVTLMQLIVALASALTKMRPKPSNVIRVAPDGVVVTVAFGEPSRSEYTWIGFGGDGSAPSIVSRTRQPPVPVVGSTTRRAGVLPRIAGVCAHSTPLSMPAPALRICELHM